MSGSAEILELPALLAPLAGESPTGNDLRYTVYDVIKEFRRTDPKVKDPDWIKVVATANEVLATQSKDLWVAIWLTEALIRDQGFPALSYGFRLVTELQTCFWENLFPQISEGDLSYRLAALRWFTAKDSLPLWIRSIPLTDCTGDNYNWWQRQSSVDGKGTVTAAQFDAAVKATPRAFYEAAQEDLQQSQEELARLEVVVDEKYGNAGPSFGLIKEAIEDCRVVCGNLLKEPLNNYGVWKGVGFSRLFS